jgi:glutamate dehydrogenase
VVDVALENGLTVEDVAAIHAEIGRLLDLYWLLQRLAALSVASRWQARARAAMEDEIYQHWRALTAAVLRFAERAGDPVPALGQWSEANRKGLDRLQQIEGELRSAAGADLPMFAVVLAELRQLVLATERTAAPQSL